jgi:hypothetical protein
MPRGAAAGSGPLSSRLPAPRRTPTVLAQSGAGGTSGPSKVAGLGDGYFSYTAPREMAYHRKEVFTLRVSRKKEDLHQTDIHPIGKGTVVTQATNKLTRAVRAVLKSVDFDIHSWRDEDTVDVVIPDAGNHEWNWDVTPLHGGPGTLHLTIYALEPNGLTSPDRTIADIEIPVYTSNAEIVWQYLVEHPEFTYLFLTGVGGVAIIALRARRRRSAAIGEPQAPAEAPAVSAMAAPAELDFRGFVALLDRLLRSYIADPRTVVLEEKRNTASWNRGPFNAGIARHGHDVRAWAGVGGGVAREFTEPLTREGAVRLAEQFGVLLAG